MSKVLVDRELLAGVCSMVPEKMKAARKELRAILAQPEDPEGFEIARHSKRLVEQLRSDLSAVTSERDRLRKDAERYRWASSGVHEAETLVSIVNCHGGYAEKVAERVDVYREAAMAAKEA